MRSRRRRAPEDLELLTAITELAGDGYCQSYRLHAEPFRHRERRAVGRALRRAANRGLIIERRGPDGRPYVAIAAEGWRLLAQRAA